MRDEFQAVSRLPNHMNKKRLFSIIGAIVLGALGSGLWDLMKPLLGWSWSGILALSTLGMDSLRDGMYANAANVIGRPPGIMLTVQLVGAVVTFTGAVILCAIRTTSRAASPSPTHPVAAYYLLLLLVVTIAQSVAASRYGYIIQLANYSAKLETIAAPYLSDLQLKQLRAEYVQIDGRAAYLAHIEALRKKIEAAGKIAPAHEFF